MHFIKQYSVWLALGLTLIASAWVSQQESDAPDAVVLVQQKTNVNSAKPESMRSTANPSSALGDGVYKRLAINDTPQNLFTALASPEPLSDEVASTGPLMPVNPFTYEGKLLENGKLIVFLTDGVRNHLVQVGDVLDDVWQIQSIQPPELTLKYIPLKTEIKMQIGA